MTYAGRVTDKPIMYLGIDGVINVRDFESAGFRRYVVDGEPVNIPLEMPERIAQLRGTYDITVLSLWNERAKPILSAIGAPDLDWLPVDWEEGWNLALSAGGDPATVAETLYCKAPVIVADRLSSRRSFVWIDTQLSDNDRVYLFENLDPPVRHRLFATADDKGLSETLTNRLLMFADSGPTVDRQD